MTRIVSVAAAALLALPAVAAAQAPLAPLAPLRPALPRTHTPKPTTGAITPADLMTRLYIYADDSMMGRAVGTAGNVKATTYIAAELKKIGLVPAGDSGTYFQTIPLTERGFRPGASMHIGGTNLVDGTDFILRPPSGLFTMKDSAFPTIYGGEVGGTTSLTPEQVRGKMVVFAPKFSEGHMVRAPIPQWALAASVLAVINLDSLTPARRAVLTQPSVFMGDVQMNGSIPQIVHLNARASTLIFGKELSALTDGATGNPVAVTATSVDRPATNPGRNVVGILRGSDPVLRNQYVAIGAHNDHIGTAPGAVDHDSLRLFNHVALILGADAAPRQLSAQETADLNAELAKLRASGHASRPDSIYNGADDDGSGTVSVLEIAQYLASLKVKPKRSIIFVWHTGEETGLWGSTYFTDHPTVPRDSIVAQLNMDMVGRGSASDIAGGKPGYLQLVGSRRLSTQLGDIIEEVNKTGKHGIAFDYTFDAPGHPQQIYCRSDHYSYARYGIPVTFFTTGGHPDYHQLTDEPEYIDYDHMAQVASFVADIAKTVADRAERPVVDQPKPDPRGMCRQ